MKDTKFSLNVNNFSLFKDQCGLQSLYGNFFLTKKKKNKKNEVVDDGIRTHDLSLTSDPELRTTFFSNFNAS